MIDPLREMFRYHYWATFTIIDYLATLPPERLNDAVPGTAGTIHATLTHLVAADNRYLQLMTESTLPGQISEKMSPSLPEIRDQFAAQVKLWESLLDTVDELDPTIRWQNEPPVEHTRNLLMTQAIHHGNDHRTHICTTLGATGQEVPEIDEWTYWFSPEHDAALA